MVTVHMLNIFRATDPCEVEDRVCVCVRVCVRV
jgi:hypothetical protein